MYLGRRDLGKVFGERGCPSRLVIAQKGRTEVQIIGVGLAVRDIVGYGDVEEAFVAAAKQVLVGQAGAQEGTGFGGQIPRTGIGRGEQPFFGGTNFGRSQGIGGMHGVWVFEVFLRSRGGGGGGVKGLR